MLANSRNSNPKKLRHGFLGTPMNRFLISTFGLTERGCIKIEISFHFVILNGVKDLEYTISNTQADAHEILRYAQNDITF